MVLLANTAANTEQSPCQNPASALLLLVLFLTGLPTADAAAQVSSPHCVLALPQAFAAVAVFVAAVVLFLVAIARAAALL